MRLESMGDIPDLMSSGFEEGCLILEEADLGPAFFDLKTGLAGELFQKFVNYRIRLALVISDPAARGERIVELAREYRTHPMVRILPSREEALAWLSHTGAASAG